MTFFPSWFEWTNASAYSTATPTSTLMTDDQLDALHALVSGDLVGSDVDDLDLEQRWARLGNIYLVAQELLNIRLNALLKNPGSFGVTGYSENNSANIAALRERLDYIQSILDRLGVGIGSSLSSVLLTRSPTRRRR